MKFNKIATIVLTVSVTAISCTSQVATKETTLNTELDSVSYALGINIGSSIKTQFVDIDLDVLAAAIKDAYDGNEKMTNEACLPILQSYVQEAQGKIAGAKLAEGEAFLAENAKREGIQVTESGLQYEILKTGNGPIPTREDRVMVHYHGTLTDGTVFDSSVDRGQPSTFGVTEVISGWTEALQLMPVGSKWKVYLPSNLAYGPSGRGQIIEPNSVLVFELELLEIEGK
jgi:FKBP-type peptidyl-prolyl cis-trans isomerase FklB